MHFIKESEETNMFTEPITVYMTKNIEALSPMKAGDKFVVVDIKYNVAKIRSLDSGKEYYIAESLLNECFAAVVEKETPLADNYIDEIMNNSEFVTCKVFDKCTIVACRLPNGFVIVESSSCVDPDDYDEDIGIENCLSRIENKICELEAYRLHEELLDCEEEHDGEKCPYTDCTCSKCGSDDCDLNCPDED